MRQKNKQCQNCGHDGFKTIEITGTIYYSCKVCSQIQSETTKAKVIPFPKMIKTRHGEIDQNAYYASLVALGLRPTCFICSPLRGDIAENMNRARHYCRYAISQGFNPYAPHIFYTQFLDDNNPAERELGMKLGAAWLTACDELWVFGEPTEGMQREIAVAKAKDVYIRRFNTEVTSDAK